MKIIILIITLLFAGCSQKTEHPIQIENSTNRNVSLSLINKTRKYVPKDNLLMHQNWHYIQRTYRNRYLFENEEIAATFYLAHHATHIYIQGSEYNFRKYRKYFLENQVTARIKFVPSTRLRRNKVIIDYFHILNYNENSISIKNSTTGKNLVKANCDVVEIPKNFIKDFR